MTQHDSLYRRHPAGSVIAAPAAIQRDGRYVPGSACPMVIHQMFDKKVKSKKQIKDKKFKHE